jgi:hypothetical protein
MPYIDYNYFRHSFLIVLFGFLRFFISKKKGVFNMKNSKANVGSFAIAKLQAKMRSILAIITFVTVIGFSLVTCDDSGGSSGGGGGGTGGGGGGSGTTVSVTGVTLNKSSISSLTVGSKETLTATVAPSNATNKTVNWSTSNSAVATVSNGVVTAVASGTATITVTTADGSKTATCSVTVPSLPALSGSISISPNSSVTTYRKLTATYSGYESGTKRYQWKKGSTNVGTNSNEYTPTEAGSYTVTVSITGYDPKTSSAVTVALSNLAGTISISPTTGVVADKAQLTATYSGSETVSYQWKKGSTDVGTNSNKYTPTEAGSYTVTVSMTGYDPKTSAAVNVVAGWTAVSNTNSTFGTSSINAIAYGNNKFVAVGDSGKIATSTNGTTWTAVSQNIFGNDEGIFAIAYGYNYFVAGGANGKIAYSTDDGTTWTAISNKPVGNANIYAITRGSYFVAVGATGAMATSTNGETWTIVQNHPLSGDINAIVFDNLKYVAGGEKGMAYSSSPYTGSTWRMTYSTSSIYAIAYGNDKFVAGGSSGKMTTAPKTFNTTTDWTAVTDSTFGTNDRIKTIAYGNDKFVAGGSSGKMAYSTDGETWTAITVSTFGTSSINAIAYGNNKFVAVGDSGKMAYSQNNY